MHLPPPGSSKVKSCPCASREIDPRSIMPVSVPSATKTPIQGVVLGDCADSVSFEYGEEKLGEQHYDREACGAQLLRLSATEGSARSCPCGVALNTEACPVAGPNLYSRAWGDAV